MIIYCRNHPVEHITIDYRIVYSLIIDITDAYGQGILLDTYLLKKNMFLDS